MFWLRFWVIDPLEDIDSRFESIIFYIYPNSLVTSEIPFAPINLWLCVYVPLVNVFITIPNPHDAAWYNYWALGEIRGT